MSKRSVRSIAAIVSLLFAASQASAAICVPCPGCSPAQMLQAAIDKRQGVRLVWNPTDGSIREYRVTCGIEPNEATTRCAGIEGEAPQMMHDIAATLLRLSNATGGTYKATAEIRANRWSIRTQPNPSARDYVADANYRAQLLDRIEQDGLASVPGVAGEVMPYLMENDVVTRAFTDQVEAVVTVAFDDGSKIDVRLAAGRRPMYANGSARDAAGGRLDDGVLANGSPGAMRAREDQNGFPLSRE